MIFENAVPDLSRERVVIVVWHATDCPHCAEYIPRFRARAARYAHCLPIILLDANDRRWQAIADYHRVGEIPVTLVLFRGRQMRADGAVDDWFIENLLWQAARGLSCSIG